MISIPVQHCYKTSLSSDVPSSPSRMLASSTNIVDPGMMTPAVGPLISAATATAVKNVKESKVLRKILEQREIFASFFFHVSNQESFFSLFYFFN